MSSLVEGSQSINPILLIKKSQSHFLRINDTPFLLLCFDERFKMAIQEQQIAEVGFEKFTNH